MNRKPSEGEAETTWENNWNEAIQLHENHEFDAAIKIYNRLLNDANTKTQKVNVLANLCLIHMQAGAYEKSQHYGEQAVKANPDNANAWNNLGIAYKHQKGLMENALKCWRKSLDLNKNQPHVWGNLTHGLTDTGYLDEAIEAGVTGLSFSAEEAVLIEATLHAVSNACRWDLLDDLINKASAIIKDTGSINPYVLFPYCSNPSELLALNKSYAKQISQGVKALPPLKNSPTKSPKKKQKKKPTRVGFLSNTLRDHATGYLLREILDHLGNEDLTIIAFTCHRKCDTEFTPMLLAKFDASYDLADLTDIEAAKTIRAQNIDILIDIDGFTNAARPRITAYRPAPIQINWLGYPSTMGADFIDYIIADKTLVPPELEHGYSEKIIRLAGGYQPNDNNKLIADRFKSRADVGLPEDAVTICVFNQMRKISMPVLLSWRAVLKAEPKAILWFWENNPYARRNITNILVNNGIAEERLFFSPTMQPHYHLNRYKFADIYADTYPCNGHTMAADALSLNVPTVTWAGEVFPSRVAASIMTQLGQDRWIATDQKGYQERLIALACNKELRQDVRQSIEAAAQSSGYFSGKRFANELRQALLAL